MLARIRTTWRALTRRLSWERELDEELRLHVELRGAELIRSGVPLADAARQARLELGSREAYKEEARAAFGLRRFDELRQDLRYASRTLRRSPGFTAVAVISLALGIGANTVVFSVLNALLLRPPAVAKPEEIHFVQEDRAVTMSFPEYRDFRDRNVVFSGLAGSRLTQIGLDNGSGAERVWGYLVTGNYFDVLGVEPALGRFFTPNEDRLPGASPYAVLSYACWLTRFQADRGILGKTVRINAMPYTVLGVAPRGFQGTELFFFPEVWVPMMMQAQIENFPWLKDRYSANVWAHGRLKAGVTRRQAEANLNAIAALMAREYPLSDANRRFHLARPGLIGDELRKPVAAFIAGVMLLAALVLLAACANLAALLSARAADRFREMAIRVSIGAGRMRLVRQLLTEAVVLALLAGALGSALAVALLRLVSQWRAPLEFPVQFDVHPDARVLAFALVVSTLTGLIFGMAPARHAWRLNPNDSLKGTQIGPEKRWPVRDVLFAGQFALCCLLVTSSFVALRGLSRAVTTPAGFEPRGVAVMSIDLALAHYSRDAGRDFQRRALDEIKRLPGVTGAAYGNSVPLSVDQSHTRLYREDAADVRLTSGIPAVHYEVSPGYFSAMGTHLRAGRDFTWGDDAKTPPIAIVNETLARKLVGTPDAVGRRFRGHGRLWQIAGVVEDGKYETLTENQGAVVFFPAIQEYNSTTVLIARSALPESVMAHQMEQAVRRLDPALPVYGAGSLSEMLGLVLLPARAATLALSAFGILAGMLAITGISGLANYAVSRRVREIGIRVALGADSRQVLGAVLGRMAMLLLIGLAAGLAAGAAASRVLANIVYQATSRDPVVLGGVILTMVIAALAAGLGPVRRALSLDPLLALRHE